MNQVVTFSSVETKKTGVSKKGPWALRLFTTTGGTKFQTFDVDLGESLEGHLNLPLEITYEIEDNGDFKNNVIKGWKPASEQAVQASEPVQSVASNGGAAELRPTSTSSQDEFRRSKEEMRYTEAVKAAATILAGPNYDPQKIDGTIEELAQVAHAIAELIAS